MMRLSNKIGRCFYGSSLQRDMERSCGQDTHWLTTRFAIHELLALASRDGQRFSDQACNCWSHSKLWAAGTQEVRDAHIADGLQCVGSVQYACRTGDGGSCRERFAVQQVAFAVPAVQEQLLVLAPLRRAMPRHPVIIVTSSCIITGRVMSMVWRAMKFVLTFDKKKLAFRSQRCFVIKSHVIVSIR